MRLCDLNPKDEARIKSVNMKKTARESLFFMGVTVGKTVTVLRRAPLGGPIMFEASGAYFAIRLSDAALITVVKT